MRGTTAGKATTLKWVTLQVWGGNWGGENRGEETGGDEDKSRDNTGEMHDWIFERRVGEIEKIAR